MARIKERRKIVHQPTTHEILFCLRSMPRYCQLLLTYTPHTVYSEFLQGLVDRKFYQEQEEKTSIKQIAADFKTDTARITQWIKKIYEDIFELNFEHPEYFQKPGIKVCFYCSYYDSHCSFYTFLTATPREYETVNFSFVKAKVGSDRFWVKRIEHEIAGDTVITIWLEGEPLNRHREFILEKALFQEYVGFMDTYHKHSFELDDMLKKLYRN